MKTISRKIFNAIFFLLKILKRGDMYPCLKLGEDLEVGGATRKPTLTQQTGSKRIITQGSDIEDLSSISCVRFLRGGENNTQIPNMMSLTVPLLKEKMSQCRCNQFHPAESNPSTQEQCHM